MYARMPCCGERAAGAQWFEVTIPSACPLGFSQTQRSLLYTSETLGLRCVESRRQNPDGENMSALNAPKYAAGMIAKHACHVPLEGSNLLIWQQARLSDFEPSHAVRPISYFVSFLPFLSVYLCWMSESFIKSDYDTSTRLAPIVQRQHGIGCCCDSCRF